MRSFQCVVVHRILAMPDNVRISPIQFGDIALIAGLGNAYCMDQQKA